jgi:hypothetical protein
MSLDARAVFQDGIDAFLSRKAVALIALFVGVGALASVAVESVVLAFTDALQTAILEQEGSLPPDVQAEFDLLREQLAWAIEIPGPIVFWLFVASVLVGEVARVGAIRALADDASDAPTFEHFARRFWRVLANRVVVAILTTIVVAVTAVVTLLLPLLVSELLVLVGVAPFFYVVVGVYFASYAVTLDDDAPLAAFERSWGLVSGNRWSLALVAVGVVAFSVATSLPTVVAFPVDPGAGGLSVALDRTPFALAFAAVAGSVANIFRVAVATHAYRHLLERDRRPADGSNPADRPAEFDDAY